MDFYVNFFLYLGIYSFIGWCCECIYCSLGSGKVVNRGFLYGPFCPIYGFGALGTIYLLQWVPHNISTIFIAGVILTSSLEYFTSWAMEKLFKTSWWDYSDKKFNINGRVCLLNSTLFGFLCVILTFDLHPKVSAILELRNLDFKLGFLFAFFIYLVADFSVTLYNVIGINIQLVKLEDIKDSLEAKYHEMDSNLSLGEFHIRIKELDIHDKMIEEFDRLIKNNTFYQRRLMAAFPNMNKNKYKKKLEKILDKRLNSNKKDL
ncbi:MAG: putative ABC transporter permease [Eubacteriales bacterium]